MQPLNPFLAAFFRSSVHSQCTPVHHHILLVPLTDVLLTCRDIEGNTSPSEVIASEDFLASHVLRIPPPGGKDGSTNLRDMRGKLKQVTTVNGKHFVIKDSIVWAEKGAKGHRNAQILSDTTFYPDVFEPRQWLLYYISRPLVGTWEEVKIEPAILIEGMGRQKLFGSHKLATEKPDDASDAGRPEKIDIRNFHELLNNFPAIARQMQPGLEKLFVEFTTVFQKPLPPPPSANDIPDPQPDGPIITAMKKARSDSLSLRSAEGSARRLSVNETFYAEDDEDVLRTSLETAVTAAIDLFQNVDKNQLSILGVRTELTGPMVERLIERYVTENINHLLWPRLSASKRQEDLELEAKIRQMEFIDISQLGIALEGGPRGKHDLLLQLGVAIEEFRKITSAMSPQEMMDLLLSTLKTVSQLTEGQGVDGSASDEKPIMTVNADTLVSMLLYVVIRAGVRNLQARLTYIRNFVFIDDVDSGELGYALSTFEAVLTYLVMDSSGLRRASRRNKALWDSIRDGKLEQVKDTLEPSSAATISDGMHSPDSPRSRRNSTTWSVPSRSSRRSSWTFTISERFSSGSGLSHVFPFQNDGYEDDDGADAPTRRIKRVAMDTRSMSSGSEISFHSRTASLRSVNSALEGDISPERLSQTNDGFGESLPMMTIQKEQVETLKYLLSLKEHYPIEFIIADMNNENTTLLSAAVQLAHTELINIILTFVSERLSSHTRLANYLSLQDIWGRSVGHYLFNAPQLITRIGQLISWRQRDKNGQTPLFALCRSYDHADYHAMVKAGLRAAREAQRDGERLHLDEHVDTKGNTLLHIINDPSLTYDILRYCDLDVNAQNDKRFTPLMVASKYGRYDMVRSLFADPRTDLGAKELRGLTAVELAKDEDVRNKIDDLTLFGMQPGRDGRITGVVRAFFVEDGTVRLVLKSAMPTDRESYTVTTSRRSFSEFEHLIRLLAEENPASWIPSLADTRSPFQIPTKPSRSLLRDIQAKTDTVLKVLLNHPTFATHEMLWEFFLVPELQLGMMEQRTKLKAETRVEKIVEDYEPVKETREVEQFVNHAREMVRSVSFSTKSVTRRANSVGLAAKDMYDSAVLLHRAVSTLPFLPSSHLDALADYVRSLLPVQSNPQVHLHISLLGVQTTTQALLSALSRPATLIGKISAAKREIERNSTTTRPSRWPLGILDETRQRMQEEKEERARKSQEEADYLARELRYTQQTVAGELAGWQSMHDKMGRRAIRDYARGMVIQERNKLEGMTRALRKVKGRWGEQGLLTSLKVQDREMADAAESEAEEMGGGDGQWRQD